MTREATDVLLMPPLGLGGWVTVKIATMRNKAPIRAAPAARAPLRPILSTKKAKNKKHAMTLAMPKKPLKKRALLPAPTDLNT